jgi:hypothetical protein
MNYGDTFCSVFHASSTKPAGFTKKGRLFRRKHEGFEEVFQIQGSAWNSAEEAWRFYINAGIQFSGLDVRHRGFADSHAACRLRVLVSAAPEHYDVSPATIDSIITKVWSDISMCSSYFERRYPILRQLCVDQNFSGWFLNDPEIGKKPSGYSS